MSEYAGHSRDYTGRVDELGANKFLATIRADGGADVHLKFPMQYAINAGLQAGDYFRYVMIREGGVLKHSFRKVDLDAIQDQR